MKHDRAKLISFGCAQFLSGDKPLATSVPRWAIPGLWPLCWLWQDLCQIQPLTPSGVTWIGLCRRVPFCAQLCFGWDRCALSTNSLQTKWSLQELRGRWFYGEILTPFGSISYTSSMWIVWIIAVTSLCNAIQGVYWPNHVLKDYTNHTSVFRTACFGSVLFWLFLPLEGGFERW